MSFRDFRQNSVFARHEIGSPDFSLSVEPRVGTEHHFSWSVPLEKRPNPWTVWSVGSAFLVGFSVGFSLGFLLCVGVGYSQWPSTGKVSSCVNRIQRAY